MRRVKVWTSKYEIDTTKFILQINSQDDTNTLSSLSREHAETKTMSDPASYISMEESMSADKNGINSSEDIIDKDT